MTFTQQNHVSNSGIALEISVAVHAVMQRLSDYRSYRRTLSELSRLDARTLADLGMDRSGIGAAAKAAIYGSNA